MGATDNLLFLNNFIDFRSRNSFSVLTATYPISRAIESDIVRWRTFRQNWKLLFLIDNSSKNRPMRGWTDSLDNSTSWSMLVHLHVSSSAADDENRQSMQELGRGRLTAHEPQMLKPCGKPGQPVRGWQPSRSEPSLPTADGRDIGLRSLGRR